MNNSVRRDLHSALLNYINDPTSNRKNSLIKSLNKYFGRNSNKGNGNVTNGNSNKGNGNVTNGNSNKGNGNGNKPKRLNPGEPWMRKDSNGKNVYTSTNNVGNNKYYRRVNNSNVYERNVNGQKKRYRWIGTNFEEINNRPNKNQPWEVNLNGRKYFTNRNKQNYYIKNNLGRYYKKNTNKQYHWNPNTNKFTEVITVSLMNEPMDMPAIRNTNNQPWKKVFKNGTSVYMNRPNSNNHYIKAGVNKYTKNNKYYQWIKGIKQFKEINKNIFNLLP